MNLSPKAWKLQGFIPGWRWSRTALGGRMSGWVRVCQLTWRFRRKWKWKPIRSQSSANYDRYGTPIMFIHVLTYFPLKTSIFLNTLTISLEKPWVFHIFCTSPAIFYTSVGSLWIPVGPHGSCEALWDLSMEQQAAEIIQQFQGLKIFAEARRNVPWISPEMVDLFTRIHGSFMGKHGKYLSLLSLGSTHVW